MVIYRKLRKYMEIQGKLWKFMRAYGNLKVMENFGYLQKIMNLNGKFWKISHLWKFMVTFGNFNLLVEIYE